MTHPARGKKKKTNKPSRPLTAYNLFFHDERQKLQERLFKITGQRPTYTQISRLVGANWKKISPDKKAAYEALAIKDKRRYALELVNSQAQQEFQVDANSNVSVQVASSVPVPTAATASATTTSIALDKNPPSKPDRILASALANYPTSLPLSAPSPATNVAAVSTATATTTTTTTTTTTFPHVYQRVNPNSASFQAMLRQNMAQNSDHSVLSFPIASPAITAQIALLSAMMIEYVQKVAPEKLARDGAPQNVTALNTAHAPTPTKLAATEAFNEDDVQFLGETFGLDDDDDEEEL